MKSFYKSIKEQAAQDLYEKLEEEKRLEEKR